MIAIMFGGQRPRTGCLVLTLAVAAWSHEAGAACRFTAQPVVLCEAPRAAAYAYEKVGHNVAALQNANTVQLLQEARCSFDKNVDLTATRVLQTRRGRVATEAGGVDVVEVLLNGRFNYIVAAPYLQGTCEWYSQEAADRDRSPARPQEPTRARRTPN